MTMEKIEALVDSNHCFIKKDRHSKEIKNNLCKYLYAEISL